MNITEECTYPGCPEQFEEDLDDGLVAHGVTHMPVIDHLEVYTPGGRVLQDIADERDRQDARWGEQNHPDGTGTTDADADALTETSPDRLRTELVQVAAVAAALIQHLDRRHPTSGGPR